ncbi:delta-1-pyrroline-5-carboxylate dehydrogenase [Lentinula raphanica]|nr:delta-1-pyrroline-5-carboxylate dehydrogenase [Lentinula raphanica]
MASAQLATFKKSYAPGSVECAALERAITEIEQQLLFEFKTGKLAKQPIPQQTTSTIENAALAAEAEWESMPCNDRAAIFLKAADLFVEELYAQQPSKFFAGAWNYIEFRPLVYFVFAVTHFNFTSISGNLCATPALVGNVIVWKPSPAATLSNYIAIGHKSNAALNFTGSTFMFKKLWKDIAANLDKSKGYRRISAEVRNAVNQAVRGQKCSVLSRLYVSFSLWTRGFKDLLGRLAFDKITSYIQKAKDAGAQILVGGNGACVHQFLSKDIVTTRRNTLLGLISPVYVFEDADYENNWNQLISQSPHHRKQRSPKCCRYNEKCTSAVVGQQPFGARLSGTNDKAGSISIFYRFVSARSIKGKLVRLEEFH